MRVLKNLFFSKSAFCVFIAGIFLVCTKAKAIDTLKVIREIKPKIDISAYLQVLADSSDTLYFEDIRQVAFYPAEDFRNKIKTHRSYWLKINLLNNLSKDKSCFLYLDNWSYMDIWLKTADKQWIHKKNGNYVALQERETPRSSLYLELLLESGRIQEIYLRVRQEMGFYKADNFKAFLYNPALVEQENSQRLFYQGVFFGVIFVMAFYNLLIYFSVKDVSSLYYVLSLVGIGLYFMFYYGFTLELFWGKYPIWNAHSFALIVPLTRIMWVLFTKSYLHLSEILPRWNKVLNLLILLYLVPIISGGYNLLTSDDRSVFTVNWIGVMGVIVLSMMILMGILTYRKGYKPALYFLIANMVFSIGSIMFIFRETGFLSDNFLTRYSVQIGVIIQVILFSLGLADRLNTIRQALAQKELDNERLARERETERKELMENQKNQLEIEVSERTADLIEKTEELQITVAKLQESENNLKELNHIKDKFFSIISHDLRSPLATLNSFLNILINFSESYSKEELQKLADKTRQSVKGLSLLLDNLLQWAMSQMNQLSFEAQKLNLADCVNETITLLSVSAEEKRIQLDNQIQEEVFVFADSHILGFVLRNLLINAIKFTDSEGKICISALVVKDNLLEIAICDTGTGIAKEELPKLFRIGHHFSGKGTKNEKGSGLGLVLCKEFVEKSGGKIGVKSIFGKGSTFYFTIPTKSVY